jgi:hypothetical protein
MPHLTHLEILCDLSDHNAQMATAAHEDASPSSGAETEPRHAWRLQGCTQLKALSLSFDNLKRASPIAHLTGLTQLEVFSVSMKPKLLSAAEQSELGSTLAALSNLQSLRIDHAPPGPVAQALSQLTGLTELALTRQDLVPNPGPLTLPTCVRLSFWNDIAIQHLRSMDAPQLQHLLVSLAVKPSDLDALRLLCKGVLRACSSLVIHLGKAWSKEDTVALMAALSQDWQPTAEAVQPIRLSSSDFGGSNPPGLWSLCLSNTRCSRECLELLPKGLSSLRLRWVLGCTQTICVAHLPLSLPPATRHQHFPCPVSPQFLHPGP